MTSDLTQDRPADWSRSDDEFSQFIAGLARSTGRIRRLAKEQQETYPIAHVMEQTFEAQTDQLRRGIAMERARWFAEQTTNRPEGQNGTTA